MARKCLSLLKKRSMRLAFAIEDEVVRARGFSVGFGGDDWGDRSIVEGGDEGVGVERLVSDQSAGIDGFDQRFSTNEIVILARAEHHLDRIAEGVDERVNLGGQSAAGSANGLRAVSRPNATALERPSLLFCERIVFAKRRYPRLSNACPKGISNFVGYVRS
jgi:hypothetical protein